MIFPRVSGASPDLFFDGILYPTPPSLRDLFRGNRQLSSSSVPLQLELFPFFPIFLSAAHFQRKTFFLSQGFAIGPVRPSKGRPLHFQERMFSSSRVGYLFADTYHPPLFASFLCRVTPPPAVCSAEPTQGSFLFYFDFILRSGAAFGPHIFSPTPSPVGTAESVFLWAFNPTKPFFPSATLTFFSSQNVFSSIFELF